MFNRHVLEYLSAYLDNELKPDQKQKVEGHLKVCVFCQKELATLKALSLKMKTWQAPGLSPVFESSVREELVRREVEGGGVKMKNKTWFIMVPSGVLAGILVVAFLGVYNHRGMQGKLTESMDNIGQQYEPYYVNSLYESTKPEYLRSGQKVVLGAAKDNIISQGYYGAVPLKGEEIRNTSSALVLSVDSNPKSWQVAGSGSHRSVEHQHLSKAVSSVLATPLINTPVEGQGTVIVIQPVLPATGEGDKIIRSGEIRIEVEDGKKAYNRVSVVCQELGGYLAESKFYKDYQGRESGRITMRIPKDKFTIALDRVSALGKVENIDTKSLDVSQEYINLKSRLDASMIVYNKMLDALQKKQVTIPEAMRLESELTPITRQIEDLKNKIEYLNNSVSFTTIVVNFYESAISFKALKESKRFVRESMLNTAINGVKLFSSFLPLLVVLVVVAVFIIALVMVLKHCFSRFFKRG